jgi:chromate reductase
METVKSKKIIGLFAGSLRKDAFSKKTARYLASKMPAGFEARLIGLEDLTFYNPDLDGGARTPRAWTDFRKAVSALDGFIFVTPEYNRSLTPALKNALDIASRPAGQNLWSGKPGAVISVSTGRLGAFGANHHLRQSMMFLNIYVMQQPEAYLSEAEASFDSDGGVTDAGTAKFLDGFITAFAGWVGKF